MTKALPPSARECSRVRVVVAPISKFATSRVAEKIDFLIDATLRHDFIGAGQSVRTYRDPYQRNRQVAFL